MRNLASPYAKLTPLAFLLALGFRVVGGDSLTIEPRVVESKYCLEPKGVVTLRVTLRLHYHNAGVTPIVLPRVTRISAQMLFGDRETTDTNHAVVREVFKSIRMYDTAKLDPLVPDPKLFDIIKPGETFDQREHEVILIVRPEFPRGARILGTSPFLRVEIDHWPADRASGKRLQRSWRAHGVLVIDKIVSLPVQIHVKQKPLAKPCREPPIVTIRRKG